MARRFVALVMVAAAAAGVGASARERVWQTGTWRDVRITRPKVVFGPTSSQGFGSRQGKPPAMTEVRTYVIETADLRLELKETTASDARAVDAEVGDMVTFSLERDTVYIKEVGGREHALHVTRKTSRPPS
jgi:hypothetical protein